MCYDGSKSTESRIEENARAETEVNTILVGREHRTPVGLDSGIEYSATHRPRTKHPSQSWRWLFSMSALLYNVPDYCQGIIDRRIILFALLCCRCGIFLFNK